MNLPCRAGELAYQFLTKTDDWGLVFSVVPEMGTLFPSWSGYTEIRDVSTKLYRTMEVRSIDHVELEL